MFATAPPPLASESWAGRRAGVLHLSFLIYKKRRGDGRYQGPLQFCCLWVFSWRKLESGRGRGRPREPPTLFPSCSEGAASSTAARAVPGLHGVPGKAAEVGGRAWEDRLSLTIQPSKARNRQKVKIPFVNKIELFDCETSVRGI